MKSLYIVLLVALVVFTSCEKHPIASFYSSEIDVYVNEDVFFTNTSIDAKYFEWEFGDGT